MSYANRERSFSSYQGVAGAANLVEAIWWKRNLLGVDYGTALEAVEAIRGIYDAKIRRACTSGVRRDSPANAVGCTRHGFA